MTSNDELSSVQIEARISQFEKQLDRLYRQFEQYFVGVEKRPPHQGRRDIMRMYRELEQMPMVRTDLKFRFRGLSQRLTTYKVYWTRVEREIENGTYHRDVARAKARQKKREAYDSDAALEQDAPDLDAPPGGQAADGAFDLGGWDLDDLDLSSLEKEFEAMDQRGEFEKYVGTRKVRQPLPASEQPAPPAAPSQSYQDPGAFPPVDTSLKKKRLAELQAKLGLSTGAAPGRNPFERGEQEPTQRARPENPSAPSRGADISKLREMQRAKQRIQATRQAPQARLQPDQKAAPRADRVIVQRSAAVPVPSNPASSAGFSEEKSRKIYNTLLQAKQRCKEDTSKLNYDAFKTTIERQRTQIQRTKGARDVDFKVVIKDGRAFLKPETKE